ncbi:ferric enterobactin transport ATP-binding protein FepC [Streptococcus pneumoniae]|uniref:Ferric enterobactin transport ATP-binding protein FepC n=2 Tax=Streptococcus pneumoniae TaxID=1313 RepID=A0A4J1UTD1_STREE|nr:ferric enterobactin transport ATP-binding protein FepC [Streptococcus pneumoniae]VJT13532.1 ferric enterobactin transport ATP-binding protein FepC [Streptococcus pneumoniae]VJT81999.1 ferric enterobactin transport ATP-binding protein FepC [Streptococcus pneumoniae]VJU76742.1 ferric enterobactin transport ATP-binding protein FepC [Streptococcus pneumoniae]VJV51115.1 ferric enterobactin transport ATP-binding protein FepC [Streptococcus pneumoniae]
MKGLWSNNLTCGYDEKIILENINIKIPEEKISVIIGSNGCGKSTLIKTLSRLIKPLEGEVLLDNKSINSYKEKDLAKHIAILPQSPIIPESITVADLVSRGRFPYRKPFKSLGKDDLEIINRSMVKANVEDLANNLVEELSGGQRQRVWIALALAQDTSILFLDEPTTYLDISYQIELLDLLTDLNQKYKTTICMILHDINLTARYADYLFAIKEGKLVAEGKPEDILNDKLVKDIFNLEAKIIRDPISNSPLMIPIGKHHVNS